VLELNPRADGTWDVVTREGIVHAEHVVNAGGLWAREIGALAGVYLPLHPVEHQYLVTEETAEVYDRAGELPHVMDPEGESYLRQEGRGLVIGFYEQPMDLWAVDGTRADFGHELLPDQLDRIADSLAFAFRRFPVLERAGIKRVINGPFTFTPDGNPLLGPVPGLRNFWAACGVMAGFSQGGGVGLSLAQWMVEGETERDCVAIDVARFGDFTTPGFTRARVRQTYQKRFSVSYPNEELPAARPHHTTPAWPVWDAAGAVWGSAYGMEHVNYFAPAGEPRFETPAFRRSNAFATVGAECRAVREAVGINEIHNFGKYLVEGPGAAAWLDRIMAGRLPAEGRLSLTPMLSPKGRIIGDFTVTNLGRDRFQLVASYGARAYHLRWLRGHLDAGVSVRDVSLERLGFQIAGPKAQGLLARVARGDVSTAAFPFMAARTLDIGTIRAHVQRVSYTGDLGYEIYVKAEEQIALWRLLAEAGRDLGLKPFGMRAMMSLRLEKGFGSWMREYRPDYMACETGMDRFVAWNKPVEFIGKAAALAEKAAGPKRLLRQFRVEAADADVWADEPIFHDGRIVGFCTSGGYAHWAGVSVANGFVPAALARDGLEVEIAILGEKRRATLFTTPLFDPDGKRLRG
jgi:dimethylglycine dehydrogenase